MFTPSIAVFDLLRYAWRENQLFALAEASLQSPLKGLLPPGILKRMLLLLFAGWSIWMLGLAQPAFAGGEGSPADQAAIAQTREIALQALNTRDFSKIQPYLHPTFSITTVDNQTFHSAGDFEQYWQKQLTGPIKNIAMDVSVDTPRTFLSPQTVVSHGSANSTFSFTDGSAAKMAMRWTAVLQKVKEKWTIQSLHFSSNLLDNPVLSTAQVQGRIMAFCAGLGGILVGAGVTLFFRRRGRLATVRR